AVVGAQVERGKDREFARLDSPFLAPVGDGDDGNVAAARFRTAAAACLHLGGSSLAGRRALASGHSCAIARKHLAAALALATLLALGGLRCLGLRLPVGGSRA